MMQATVSAAPILKELNDTRRRLFDARLNKVVVRVATAETYLCDKANEALLSVTGSAVALFMRDRTRLFALAANLMLPPASDGTSLIAGQRYGTYVLENAMQAFLREGCRVEDLEIKLFGGADPAGIAREDAIGQKTLQFVTTYFEVINLVPTVIHLGGRVARRIVFLPDNGRVMMKEMASPNAEAMFAFERGRQVRAQLDTDGRLEIWD